MKEALESQLCNFPEKAESTSNLLSVGKIISHILEKTESSISILLQKIQSKHLWQKLVRFLKLSVRDALTTGRFRQGEEMSMAHGL